MVEKMNEEGLQSRVATTEIYTHNDFVFIDGLSVVPTALGVVCVVVFYHTTVPLALVA